METANNMCGLISWMLSRADPLPHLKRQPGNGLISFTVCWVILCALPRKLGQGWDPEIMGFVAQS